MKITTIDRARVHCKTDADEDADLTVYVDLAEARCERRINRAIFVTEAELTAAIDGIPAAMAAAQSTYDTAMAAAAALDTHPRIVAQNVAKRALTKAKIATERALWGISVEEYPELEAAVLLTAAHFYRNREEVVSGERAAAVQLPAGAESILSQLTKDLMDDNDHERHHEHHCWRA